MKKLIENSNSEIMEIVSKKVIPLVMLRLASLVDCLISEPNNISLTVARGEDSIVLHPILRLVVEYPNSKLISTSIYADSEMSEFIVRKMNWDKGCDIKKMKSSSEQRAKLLNEWPEVTITNSYMHNNNISELIEPLDKYLLQGVQIDERIEHLPKWSEMRCQRLFDWGSKDIVVSSSISNADFEECIFSLMKNIDDILIQSKSSCYKMVSDYLVPPESYKKFISGE